MITVNVDVKRYKLVKETIGKYDIKKNANAKRALYGKIKSALFRAWRTSIDQAHLRTRTGRLKRNIVFRSAGYLRYKFEAYAPYARYVYYGTKRSRGRYLPYIWVKGKRKKLEKRFSKEKIPMLIEKYGEKWVGWHPGIDKRKFPLKSTFERVRRREINMALETWLKDISGGR